MTDAPCPVVPTRCPHLRRVLLIAGMIALLSVALRLVLVHQVVTQNEGNVDRIGGDSAQYVDLAKNLVETGRFAVDTPQARKFGTSYFSLLRPPLYPLLVAGFEIFDWRPGVLWVQAILGGFESGLIALLAGLMLRSSIAAAIAGTMMAFSPTSIGVVGLILADFLFAATFAFAFFLFWIGASRGKAVWYYIAAVVFAAASLVKPAGLYWPFVMPIVAWFLAFSTDSRFRLGHAIASSALCLAVMLSWAVRNQLQYGIFKISTVDAQNLRFYLAPLVEEWAKAGESPKRSLVKRNRERVMSRDENEARAGVPPKEIVARQWSESMTILKAHPGAGWDAYWKNIDGHFSTRFNHFELEMPKGGTLRSVLLKAENATCSNAVYWIGTTFILIGLLLPLAVPRVRRDPTWRLRVFGTYAIAGTFAYLCVFSGTTMYTGSRILYPSFFATFTMIAAGVISIRRDGAALLASPVKREPATLHETPTRPA